MHQMMALLAKVNGGYLVLVGVIVLSSIGQFLTRLTMTTLMVRAIHLSDEQSTIVYGIYSLAAVLWSIIGGPLIDKVGFRVILLFSCLVGATGRFLVASLVTSRLLYGALFGVMALGDSWIDLAITSAMMKYVSNDALRKILFGYNYGLTNIGAVIAGAVFEFKKLSSAGALLKNVIPMVDDMSQTLYIVAGCCFVLAFIVALGVPCIHHHASKRKEEFTKYKEEGGGQIAQPPSPRHDPESRRQRRLAKAHADGEPVVYLNSSSSSSSLHEQEKEDHDALMKEQAGPLLVEHNPPSQNACGWLSILASASFWRVALFSLLCFGARSVFFHIETTFVVAMKRLYGPDAPIGTMFMINPLIIAGLAPLLQIISVRGKTISIIILGTSIECLSVIPLLWASSAELGFWAFVLFSIFLSLGEALWSPLTNFYVTQIAGKKRVGTYLMVLSLITYLPRLLTALLSGELIRVFCPSNDLSIPCNTKILAMAIFAVAVTTPLFLLLAVLLKIIRNIPTTGVEPLQKKDHEGRDYVSPENGADEDDPIDLSSSSLGDGEDDAGAKPNHHSVLMRPMDEEEVIANSVLSDQDSFQRRPVIPSYRPTSTSSWQKESAVLTSILTKPQQQQQQPVAAKALATNNTTTISQVDDGNPFS